MDKNKNTTLLFAGATAGPNNRSVLVTTSATEEFRRRSPGLIISSPIKNSGVKEYADYHSVRSVKNHNARPADLWGGVISNVKPGKPLNFINDLPDFGNYEAGAN